MSAAVGKQVFLECKTGTRDVSEVVVCLYANPPYDPVDCPTSIDDATPCSSGTVYLPTTRAAPSAVSN